MKKLIFLFTVVCLFSCEKPKETCWQCATVTENQRVAELNEICDNDYQVVLSNARKLNGYSGTKTTTCQTKDGKWFATKQTPTRLDEPPYKK
jgi:hypothetical protein